MPSLLVLLLAGCASFPVVDAAERTGPVAASPPALLPLAELNAYDAARGQAQSAGQAADARAAALRAAAAALRAR